MVSQPRSASDASEYAYEAMQFWGSELEYYLTCEPIDMRRTPYWWMSPHAVSFHNYKNVSLLLDAYRIIYGRKFKLSDCSPIVTGFDVRVVGYSGHEYSIEPTVIACSLGANVIERHITLSHDLWGTDQKSSLELMAMDMLHGRLKDIPLMMGSCSKTVTPSEVEIKKKLRV